MRKIKTAVFGVLAAVTVSLSGLAIAQASEISDLRSDLADSDQTVNQLLWEIDTDETGN